MNNIIDKINSGEYKSIEEASVAENITLSSLISSLKGNPLFKGINKLTIPIFSYKTALILFQKNSISEITTLYGLTYYETQKELSKHKLSCHDLKPFKDNTLFLSEVLHLGSDELCKYYAIGYDDLSSFNNNNGIRLKKNKEFGELINIDIFCKLYCDYKLSLSQIADIYNIGIKKIREIKKSYESIRPELKPQIRSKLPDTEFVYIKNRVKLNML